MRIKIKRVNSLPEVYLPQEWRAKYAIETFRSINAPVDEQCIELELMWLDSD